jgi:ABC-2 type transport system ATP-binding protein
MTPILEITNLAKQFKGFCLNGISFTLNPGYIMGFIGPNGSGKTTTIKLIMNLLRKKNGSIKVFGMDHLEHEVEIKDRIGFVYDEFIYYENLSVKDMKDYVALFYSNWDDQAFNNYIERFELPPKKKLRFLSKGMKMKFSLAIALSHNADLLLMDEPTSGLDPLVRREVLDILSSYIQDENKSVLFSTHITSDLDKIADYITLINNGKILLSEEKDKLVDIFGLVKGGKDLLNSQTRELFVGVKENQFGFEGLVRNRKEAEAAFGDSALYEKPTIEDIMIYSIRKYQNA